MSEPNNPNEGGAATDSPATGPTLASAGVRLERYSIERNQIERGFSARQTLQVYRADVVDRKLALLAEEHAKVLEELEKRRSGEWICTSCYLRQWDRPTGEPPF
jgi:hypothetical protein